jgi:CIC family chloride channel protein
MKEKILAGIRKFLIWRVKHISNQNFIYLLSILIGFFSGLGAVVLKNMTHFIQYLLTGKLIEHYHQAFYFIFPIIGIVIVQLIIKHLIRHKVGHGIPSVLFSISKKKSFMERYQMYSSILTAPITVGFGGSVGLEGPTVATGSSIGANIARLFHVNQTTRTLLLGCAAAGAMSAIFKAPVAAIIFAIEVFSLDLTLISLVPLLLASASAVLTSYLFLGSEILLHFNLKDAFQIREVPFFILLGLISALTSVYFSKMFFAVEDRFESMKSKTKRLVLGGLGIGVLVYMIPPLYGEGFSSINNLLQENYRDALGTNLFENYLDNIWVVIAMLAGMVLFKVIATSLTFGAGGVGGIFAPTLFVGSAMGLCFAKIINVLNFTDYKISESNFALVGMAGVMAGNLHAPLTAIFLIAELTGGYELFVPLMITAAISFLVTRFFVPHSIYAMQLAKSGDLLTHDKDNRVLHLMEIDSVIENNFIVLNPDMTLGEVIENAVKVSNRNIFPVVDSEDNFVGVLLLDDIRPIMFDQAIYDSTYVNELMHNAPAVIEKENDNIKVIMRKFQDSSAWNLPVLENGKYIGFISKSKLLSAYRRKLIEVTG